MLEKTRRERVALNFCNLIHLQTVMSRLDIACSLYNKIIVILSALAHTTFIKCPKAALEWKYRGLRIIEEIARSGADILCLEEVDHFKDFFEPQLAGRGFEGIFFPKVDSPCLFFPDNNGPDGCALFYRSEKFELREKKEVVLKDIEGGESHQVALVAKLVTKSADGSLPSRSVTVAMAHLKAKTEGRELRAAQGKHLIEEAATFSEPGQPIVIAGDFNATPDEEVYQYFDSGDHGLELQSAYRCRHYGNAEPPLTSWKYRAKGEAKYTIDYIWYTPAALHVKGVWGLPGEEEIGEGALPCMAYPSDHLALCTDFSFN